MIAVTNASISDILFQNSNVILVSTIIIHDDLYIELYKKQKENFKLKIIKLKIILLFYIKWKI